MRLLDQTPVAPDPETLGLLSEIDQQRYHRTIESPLWQALCAYFQQERERLFDDDCETNQQLWENHGAQKLLTRLLRSGPLLMVQYLRQQESHR
jgi:hypothetical protein